MKAESSPLMRQIAESILGSVEWHLPDTGSCSCPGTAKHTNPTAKRDCRVMLSGAPTIYCFHTSCGTEIERANFELRSQIGKLGISEHNKPRKGQHRPPLLKSQPPLAARAEYVADRVFETWRWSLAEIVNESPIQLPGEPADDWKLLLKLFRPDDILWIGAVHESGLCYQNHFRPGAEWLRASDAPGNFICPNPVRPGEFSRSTGCIAAFRYFVVESDELSKEKIAGVFRWMRNFIRLRAIVDTAGKSLHGWFDYPAPGALTELKTILPKFGCDRALFCPSQPVRLPGARRNDKFQHLLWLDLEGI